MKLKKFCCRIFEKNDTKHRIFALSANIALLRTSQGQVLPDYTYLKNSIISSRQYLANAFMINNHHFDF